MSGATSASFTYDGDGNRVKTTFGTAPATYYVGNHFEWITSTLTMVKYYYAGGQRVAMRKGSNSPIFLLGDHLGSTAKTYNTADSTTTEQRYYPWGGTRWPTSPTTPTARRFTGQIEDTTLGLYFYNARYYDPSLGRFLQADTIVPSPANPQSLNRFSYVLNNALKYTDPTGHAHYNPGDGSDSTSTKPKVCYNYTYPQTESKTIPLPDPVATDPASIPYTFTFPWWTQYTGQGRTVPLVTFDEDFWFSKVRLSYGARIEVDGTGPLRIHYDRIKIGPTTIEATGNVNTKLLSFNLFDESHVGEIRVVTYEDELTLGIGIRAEGKTIASLTTEYSAVVSSRTEADFEIRQGRTIVALAITAVAVIAPQLAEELTRRAPTYAQ